MAIKATEDVAKMVEEEKNAQIESRLNRLWLEAGEIARKWHSLVKGYVSDSVGLHPWNCDRKDHDENNRLINVRRLESDDDFIDDYYNFQMIYDGWNERLEAWLSEVPPRFRNRFNEVFSKTERFSKQFDKQYTFVGDIPELLTLYDNFCKKKAAVDDLVSKMGAGGWNIKEEDDTAFELIQVKVNLDRFLCIKCTNSIYKVHHFRDGSDFENALVEALSKSNKTHRVETSASKLQSSISKLKIPQKLRKLMIKTSKQMLVIKPKITYGDLKRVDLDDIEIIGELNASLEKLELA